MPWTESWAARALGTSVSPVYVLRALSDGAGYSWSSHPVLGATTDLIADQCSIQWGRTGPHKWPQPVSSASFVLLPSAPTSGLYQGTILQLSIILAGEEQPVWVGVMQQITRSIEGPTELQCVGIEGALWGRMLQAGASNYDRSLFAEAGTETVVADAGGWTVGDATMSLGASPTMRKAAGAGGLYVVRVDPAGGTAFYVAGDTWADPILSHSTGDIFAVLDSTPVDVAIGTPAAVVAYDAAHPISLAARALSPQAAWPDEWTLMMPPDLVDTIENAAQLANSGLSAAAQDAYVFWTEAPLERLGDVLGPMLSGAGVMLCQYQGLIAARIIPDPATATPVRTFGRGDVVAAELQAWAVTPYALNYQVWDRTGRAALPLGASEDIDTPYGALVYAHALLGLEPPPPPVGAGAGVTSLTAGSVAATLRGQPVQDLVESRLPIFGDLADRQEARQDVHLRLKRYSTELPEALTVTLLGWHGMAVGDAVTFDLGDLLPSRADGPGGATTGANCIVVGGGPDFFGATSTYELLAVPTNTDT